MLQIGDTQEIVDLIVDHLVDSIRLAQWHPGMECRPTYPISKQLHELKQCALINKAFASRSQKHLFSTIKIHVRWVSEMFNLPSTERTSPRQEPALDESCHHIINGLLDILNEKPYLARHLRTLDICAEFGFLVKRYESLSTLMGLLRDQGNPRSLTFAVFDSYQEKRPQPDYNLQQIIGTNLQFLSCCFSEMIPISFIASNHDLQSLELAYCSAQTEDEDTYHTVQPTPRSRVKTLTLNSSWSLLDRLLGAGVSGRLAVDFSDLTYLHLTPTSVQEDVTSVQRLLFIAGPSLKELTMSTFAHDAQSYPMRLDLTACKKLHTAKLLTTVQLNETTFFEQFIDTLSTIPCPNNLTDLGIEIYLPVDSREWRHAHALLPWGAMDSELHRISMANPSSTTMSDQLIFKLHTRFYRNFMDTAVESYENAIRECEEFAKELKLRHFQLTTSNQHIEFEIDAQLDVDYLH